MRIAIGSDHRGYHLKEQLIAMLRSKGHEVDDEGTTATESVDYPDFAALVAKKVSQGVVERGILICGTGIGMAIVYRIVQDHGGRLHVDSRPGGGTTITVELPRDEAAAARAATAPGLLAASELP